jgi:hypothetical protein
MAKGGTKILKKSTGYRISELLEPLVANALAGIPIREIRVSRG